MNNSPEREGPPSSKDVPHLCFIGRWAPFHNGHAYIVKWIIEKDVLNQCKEDTDQYPDEIQKRPVLILVRSTTYDFIDAWDRKKMIEKWLEAENIEGTVMIIPDIHGVYYGRGVGYEVDEVIVPEDVKGISATAIRDRIKEGASDWEAFVPDSVAEFIRSRLGKSILNIGEPPTEKGEVKKK